MWIRQSFKCNYQKLHNCSEVEDGNDQFGSEPNWKVSLWRKGAFTNWIENDEETYQIGKVGLAK